MQLQINCYVDQLPHHPIIHPFLSFQIIEIKIRIEKYQRNLLFRQ